MITIFNENDNEDDHENFENQNIFSLNVIK